MAFLRKFFATGLLSSAVFFGLLRLFSLQPTHGEVVHISILTIYYTVAESPPANRLPLYQCYRSAPDTDASLTFGRTALITPSSQLISSDHVRDPNWRVINLNENDWNPQGFGPFYCEASKSGRDTTRITTFFIRSDAKFTPTDGLFTKTVNINDTGVVLSMDVLYSSNRAIKWQKDGDDFIDSQGSSVYTFSEPIQPADEGIYEIHYNMERNTGRGGLTRLIVRDCPSGKWGPPDCHGICDRCYNGGICDDLSGLCICPNNFKGPNCLDICRSDGGNRFGLQCEIRCTFRLADPPNACHGMLFCLPDPYGCTCDVGVKDIACNTACNETEYGPSCSQTCHCQTGTCSRYSGVCTNGECETGWSGENCQVPDVCDTGYYGPECIDKCHCLNDVSCEKMTGECPQQKCAPGYQVPSGQVNCTECRGAFFGLDCRESCHCEAEACEKVTGLCNGKCLPNWLEDDCQTGISRAVTNKVNPYQQSSMTCYVQGNPLPQASSVRLIQLLGGTFNESGITQHNNSASTTERAVIFRVDSVVPGSYVCAIDSGAWPVASLMFVADTYVLPVMGNPPSVVGRTSTTFILKWSAWRPGVDKGDAPLTSYSIFTKTSTGDWEKKETYDSTQTSRTLRELQPDTDYEVAVAAVREGAGGTGPRSNSTTAATLCGKPTATLTHFSVEARTPRQLELEWQAPPSDAARCRSGFTHYIIYFSPVNSNTFHAVSVNISNSSSQYTLSGLMTYLEYTINVRTANKDAESDSSEMVTKRTLEEIAPPPVDVAIPHSTLTSFTVMWSAASPSNLNGNIRHYEIRYRQIAPEMATNDTLVTVNESSLRAEYTILDQPSKANFSIQVRTVNGVGRSNWSEPVIAKTVDSGQTSNLVAVGVGIAVGLVLVTIAIIAVIFFMRRRQGQKQTPGLIHSHDGSISNEDHPRVIYANSGQDLENESHYEGVNVQKPPVADRKPKTKPKIVPRKFDASATGKPLVVTEPTGPTKQKGEVMPPMMPKPYEVYVKGKSKSQNSIDEIQDEENGKSGTPRHDEPLGNLGEWSWSQDNIDEVGLNEPDGEEIYQNMTLPVPVPISELEEYILDRKKGELGREYDLLKRGELHPSEVAAKVQNKTKNRFKNIIPYDYSRVVLEKVNGDPNSDYYNANFIPNYKEERAFIAAQAPNTASLGDFWRMIWQENVATIVMVTNLVEGGRDRCKLYWPKNPHSAEKIGDFTIFILETERSSDHIVRTLNVQKGDKDKGGERRTITQFHYLSWPDMGVPEYCTTLISFTESVLQHRNKLQDANTIGPMLVHCSAGVGRTGTFLSLYNMIGMMRDMGRVDVFGYVSKMRENRTKMVQTQDQYVFIYDALLEVCLSGQTDVPVNKFRQKLDELNRANPKTKTTNIAAEFAVLNTLSPEPPRNSFKSGREPQNRQKNRFSHILPMEKSRPYLACDGDVGCTDYINASFMNTFLKKDVFVATQSPLPNTVVDIWRLVLDWKCPAIVMLNDPYQTDETFTQYWPDEGSIQMGALEVVLVGTSKGTNHVTRTFKVMSGAAESVTVRQFQLLGWSASHNKPDSPLALVHLVEAVQEGCKNAENKGPIVVHCINGIGRSGVFCTIWSVIEKLHRDNRVGIFEAVKRLRANRPNMVESLDQYQLCYDVIGHHLQRFDEYANLDVL